MTQLGALGQADCGTAPGLGPGENKVCCPKLGWVVYDSAESPYGICERAAAAGSGGGGGGGSSSPAPASTGDAVLDRVAALRRSIEERRNAREEQDFERQKQELQLRFVLGRMQAVQAAEQARVAAIEAGKAAERARRAKALADAARAKRDKKIATWGAVALVGAKLLGYF